MTSAESLRTIASAAGLAALLAATVVSCATDAKEKPADTVSPSTSGSSAPQSPGSVAPTPTEKDMSPKSPNSFSPTVRAPAPTPQAPKPCLPFCE